MARLRDTSHVVVLTLLALAATATALGKVHIHLELIQIGYELSRETRMAHELGEQNQKLRLELDVRENPKQVDGRARAELGMAPPEPQRIRVVPLRRAAASRTP